MFIVDTQVHIWKDETPDRPWDPNGRARAKANGHRLEAFGYEELLQLMDAGGVDRVLLVPPSREGDRVDYVIEACEKYPDRFGIMARIPQNKPEEAKAMMRDWKSIPGIKGTRLTFHRPTDRNWFINGTFDWYWPFAEENGIKSMIHAPFWKTEVGEVAKRHPGAKIIYDHMGILSRCADDSIGYWVSETADLHEHPNIYVKVSAIPAYSTHPFPYHNVNKFVKEMISKMGARRCFWGSDLTRLMSKGLTYKEAIEHFTKHLDLSEQDLEWIMGRGVCECLGWEIPKQKLAREAVAA